MKLHFVPASIGIIVLAHAATARGQGGPSAVVTAKAQLKHLPITLTLVGTVQPITRSLLGAEVAGAVVGMPAREGDLVTQGQILCRLDDAILTLSIERDRARLEGLQAGLDELLDGTRKETLARLKAELDSAAAIAQRWVFELDRVKRLHGGDYANEKEYQDTLAEQLASEGRRLAAAAAYEEGVAGPRIEAVAQARFAVAEQQAVVDRFEIDLTKTRIRAPFTGYIVARYAEVGNWLTVGADVVELADLSRVLVRIDAPEHAILYAEVDTHVTVRVDALHKSFQGRICHVVPQADLAARTFPVEIEVDNPDFELKAGMFARATIPAGPSEDMLAVPKDALIDSHGAIQVAVIVDGETGKMAVPTFVTLGADAGDWIAITSGNIPPGADVAIYGNETLVYPQPVVVVESRDAADPTVSPATETPSPKTEPPSQTRGS